MFIDALEQHVKDEHLVVWIKIARRLISQDQLWLWVTKNSGMESRNDESG